MVDERSAGAIVFYIDEKGAIEYLLLHYTSGHWDFPKGNIESGEAETQTARREIQEETGISDVEFLEGFKKKIQYRYRHGKKVVLKEVVLFLVKAGTKQVTISHEHIGYAWKDYAGAMQQLTFKNAKNLLSEASNVLKQRLS